MTQKTKESNTLPEEQKGIINGISIASFLQMLEHERHSCRVQVRTNKKQGILFFKNGNLIDAEHEHFNGITAAYKIVSWENSSIALGDAVSRSRQIQYPLGYILLNAARHQDEQIVTVPTQTPVTYVSNYAKNDPKFQEILDALMAVQGVEHFYILDKKGKVVIHSEPNPTLGELIIYCIITSTNLRKWIHTKSPRQIHMHMKDGSSLLIVPKKGKILGMLLDARSSAAEISSQLDDVLSVK